MDSIRYSWWWYFHQEFNQMSTLHLYALFRYIYIFIGVRYVTMREHSWDDEDDDEAANRST